MDGIASHPWSSGVGTDALQLHPHAQCSLTTGFDACIGGLTENGDIADQKVGSKVKQLA